jgi:hypothetical protein
VPVPEPGDQNFLNDITTANPNDFWIVGQTAFFDPPSSRPLFLHCVNGDCELVVAEDLNQHFGRLEAVTEIAPNDIWAAGTYTETPGGLARPLLMHYDGKSWTQVPSDKDGPQLGTFFGIDAVGDPAQGTGVPCDVWAVGQQAGDTTHTQHLQAIEAAGDVNDNGVVDVDDLIAVINNWGRCSAPPADCSSDLNGDGEVNVDDMLIVINNWSL